LTTAGAKTQDVLQADSNLLQCELLYFVMGTYSQHPESTIKMTLLDFYREGEILHAKQLLVDAAERIDCLNIQNFSKKRYGINKIKSSADDIMNILRIVDEHSCHELMSTFCAVNRSRVPVIAEELSDMAAIRLELTTLRQHVEMLAKKLSEVSPCKCQRVKDTVVRRVIDVSNDAQAAYEKNVGNASSQRGD